MSQSQKITSRDPKGLYATGLFEAVYNKSELDEARAQRLNERGVELQDRIAKLIAELSVSDWYANEEVCSSHTYPKEYKGPKPINDQIKEIAKVFGLDPSHALKFAKTLPELPNGAEGWFALPLVDALAAKYFPMVDDPIQKYCRAIQFVHTKIADSRSFYNYDDPRSFYNYEEILLARLRVNVRTAHALDLIAETQRGDILIIAAQFGMRHRGRSVRRAREVFAANEFGLGAFATSIMLLTHPEREVQWEQLHVDCAGDELTPDAKDYFSVVPFFVFYNGRVEFNGRWFNDARKKYGSASAFIIDP